MGCGASKHEVVEPRPMQSHGRDNLPQIGTEIVGEAAAVNPIDLTSDCRCPSDVVNGPSPPSAFIHTPGSLSTSDEDDEDEDFDPNSFDIPSKLSIVGVADSNVFQTTALAALSGEKTVADEVEVEERVESILAANNGKSVTEQSDECCALGMLSSQSAIPQALLSTCPVITQQNLDAGCSRTRVGHVAVVSGPEPIRWEPTLRKAEIIDLDEEPDAGESVMVENTPELQQENRYDQEPAGDDHASTEEHPRLEPKPNDAIDTHKTWHSGPEPRISKLPPLTIVPPILIERTANPFAKPAFPIVLKQDLMEVKAPFVCETEQFEDLSADRTPPMGLREGSRIGDNHDVRPKASLGTVLEDSTPSSRATKSPADSEWRSCLRRDTPDTDLENIDLLESPELDSLPLVPMLDCHGIHTDKKDLISPCLRLAA